MLFIELQEFNLPKQTPNNTALLWSEHEPSGNGLKSARLCYRMIIIRLRPIIYHFGNIPLTEMGAFLQFQKMEFEP
jgi:hypothetical protein